MNKKKFLILIAVLAIVFVVIYLAIFIGGLGGSLIPGNGGSGDDAVSPGKEKPETVIYTELSSISGEVVETQEGFVKIKADISGRETLFAVNRTDNVERVSGSYENDRIVNSATEETSFSDIQKGEKISISLQNSVRVEELPEEEVEIEAEQIIINPSIDGELY